MYMYFRGTFSKLTPCFHSSIRPFHHFTRRAAIYIPAADERKLKKIPSLNNVDTVILDFEDGVALNQKETARSNVGKGLAIVSETSSERVVRINGLESNMVLDDLRSIFAGITDINQHLDALMLPKCDTTEHLAQLDVSVGFHGGKALNGPLALIGMIESPVAINTLSRICEYGVNNLVNLKLEALVFGADDYLSSIGGQDVQQLIYARQAIVTTAKAFGLQAIDYVTTDFKDMKGLEKQSLEGARIGFNGKQVIHPDQIQIVQKAFSPSDEQVEWAEGLIEEFQKQQLLGKGAFVYKGKMIDRPLLLQAQNIIRMTKIR